MLYLVSTQIDLHSLYRWVGQRQLMPGHFDLGFALHCLLAESFGPTLLQPFRAIHPRDSQYATLYAYSSENHDALANIAQAIMAPECLDIFTPLKSKAMPQQWPKGRTFGFDIKLRPIRRGKPQTGTGKVAERDVFLYQSQQTHQTLKRCDVYADWFAERLTLQGGACIDKGSIVLQSFQRQRCIRRRSDKKGTEGPDIVLQGQLQVEDPEQFSLLLTKGIGRHRSYGYGMVLLRPPRPRNR